MFLLIQQENLIGPLWDLRRNDRTLVVIPANPDLVETCQESEREIKANEKFFRL